MVKFSNNGLSVKIKSLIISDRVLVLNRVYCVRKMESSYIAVQTWFRSCGYMIVILNRILLLRQGVERNPGPAINRSNVSVRTYKGQKPNVVKTY